MAMKIYTKKSKLIICNTALAAELIAHNTDLLTQILLFVPAKSLIRFKCASKHWFSLISDSQFSINHSLRNSNPLFSGLYIKASSNSISINQQLQCVSLHSPRVPTLSFLDGFGDGSRITHSCKGLLLCFNVIKGFIVCNPTTQKSRLIPYHDRTTLLSYHHAFGAYLAFNPSKSPHYKDMLVSYSSDESSDGCFYLIDIYSSENASWKHIRVAAPLVSGRSLWESVFWNVAIHWMSRKYFHIQFDVDAERLSVFENMVDKFKFTLFKFSVLGVQEGVKKKDFTLVLAIPGKVILCNQNCKRLKVLRDFLPSHESTYYNYASASAYQFIESLSPV